MNAPKQINPGSTFTRIILLLVAQLVFGVVMFSFMMPRPWKLDRFTLILVAFFALFVLVVPLVSFWFKARKQKTLPLPAASQPRLERSDWAAGRIVSSAAAGFKAYLFMGAIFCALGGASCFTALKEVRPGNYLPLLVLAFPLVGICFLISATLTMLRRKRYGIPVFEMASTPAFLGRALKGTIQVAAPLDPEQDLRLRLVCEKITHSGSGSDRSTQTTVLWQNEIALKAEAVRCAVQPGQTSIPVFFRLPPDQPSSGSDILWLLESRAKTAGPDFRARFELPVFEASDSSPEETQSPDPTQSLQRPLEELRREEHSRIQVNDGPEGREFLFPAARNPGAALFTSLLFAIFCGVLVLIIVQTSDHSATKWHLPSSLGLGMIELFLGLFTAVIGWSCCNLWFASSRVVIDSSGVRITRRQLFLSCTRSLNADDVDRFETKAGMSVGTHTYLDLLLFTRDGRKVSLARNLGSPAEAGWLVREMTCALGRPDRS